MTKIARATQVLFANGAGFEQLSQFGSFANGAPMYTNDPATIQALPAFQEGWFAAILANDNPAIEDMNALQFLFCRQIAYILQSGVAEYDSGTIYWIGSVVNDGTGTCYVSIADNNNGNALSDSTNWRLQAGFTANSLAKDLTVLSGQSYFQPNFVIPSGTTWTVNSGGFLNSIGPVTVNGTLIINGTARIL